MSTRKANFVTLDELIDEVKSALEGLLAPEQREVYEGRAEVRDVLEEEVRNADELWLTSSTKEVLPIVTLDGKPVGLDRVMAGLAKTEYPCVHAHKRLVHLAEELEGDMQAGFPGPADALRPAPPQPARRRRRSGMSKRRLTDAR